ncbi:hypothetical protein RF11_12767 [Thelohanellus kitauei]|uniref:Uncharacterized protein n=1 Tax=Thelohanellus kitauei TaxID=669202 RepID=A0A0C2I7Y0_THEKT|nr:hypothetical protein RF11_12767 [Thelohanellus kitauei]
MNMQENYGSRKFVVRERHRFYTELSWKSGESARELAARVREKAVFNTVVLVEPGKNSLMVEELERECLNTVNLTSIITSKGRVMPNLSTALEVIFTLQKKSARDFF